MLRRSWRISAALIGCTTTGRCVLRLIEPTGGSPLRSNPAWPALGRGKRSAVLDLRDEDGRVRLHELLGQADVLVTSMRHRR